MKVAVLDDRLEDVQLLVEYLDRFQSERGLSVQVVTYSASLDFLEEYHSDYDVLFLDIEMPGANGLEVAHEVRARDESVGIIFITNMAQYAIRGYEVNAIDFMVKPVRYVNFAEKLDKALRFRQQRDQRVLLLADEDGLSRIPVSDVLYVEKDRYYLLYHTKNGVFRQRGTAKELKEQLKGLPFSDCTAGCLVNLNHVKRVGKEDVLLRSGETLPIARRIRKKFLQDFIAFAGGGY